MWMPALQTLCARQFMVHIITSPSGKENEPCDHKYDVVGSLCENCDKFAIDRMLPKIDMGDYARDP